MKKKSILLLLPFAAMALTGCGDKPTPNPCESAVVVLDKQSITLAVGDSETLVASMSVEGCALGDVTWSSDHPDIAKVENGKVTALAVGTATIIANDATCTITVTQAGPVVVHVSEISITKAESYPKMKVGDPDLQINYTVLPENADNKEVTFSCDTPAVATVSDTGLIHAIAVGEAKIVVTSVDSPEVKKELSLTVTAADVAIPNATIAGYEKVMSGELVDGSLVEFVAQSNGVVYGMKNYDSGNNIKPSQCSVDNGVLVEGSDVAVYTVEKNDDGSFSFKDSNNKYLGASTGTSNKLTAKAEKDDTCKFAVTIENGIASIVCNAEGVQRGTICLNYNGGSPLFNCYAALGNYSPVSLFAKEAGEQKDIKSIELKVSDSYDKEYLDTDRWSTTGLTVEATYTDDSKGAVDPRAYNLIFAPEAPALGVTAVSVKAKMIAGSEIESAVVVIEGITVSHNEEGVRVTGINVTDLYPKMKVGDADKQIEVTVSPENATNKEVTFTSDNTGVATISNTGLIHAVTPGIANITVASVDVPTITKTVKVEVSAPDIALPSATSDEYTKVVSGELTNGSQVEFVSQKDGKVFGMKKYNTSEGSKDNNIKAAECTISDDVLTINPDVEHYFVEKNDDNTYSFKDGAGNYIYAAGGSSSNYLKAKAEKGDTSKFNVTVTNGIANVVCAAEKTTHNFLAFNYSATNPLFSCYEGLGKMAPITLYEKAPEPAKLVSITADMTNKSYVEGDPLDLTGLVVTGHYDDETEAPIKEGYTLSMEAGHVLATTDKAIVITFDGHSCSIPLSVRTASATLESINISGAKTSYFVGDTLGTITVTAVYSDTSTADITARAELKIGENVVNASHVMALGETKLVASFEGKTANADFTVIEDTIITIAVSSEHRSFTIGAEFVPETVTATYASGKTKDVTEGSLFTGYDMKTAGDQTVTVTYGALTPITYDITISEAAPVVAEGAYDISFGGYYLTAEEGTKGQPLASDDETNAIKFDFILEENSLENYKIKMHGENLYLALTNDNNGVRIKSTGTVFNITESTSVPGAYIIKGSDGTQDRYLCQYNNADFRCYKTMPQTNANFDLVLKSVVAKDVESIAIKQNPTKMSYYVGEAFEPEGMIVTVTYTDTTTEDITKGFTFEGSTGFKAANPDRTVKITYQGKNAYVEHVSVVEDERELVGIEFADGADMTKKDYKEGESWDAAGLIVNDVYSDESREAATEGVSLSFNPATPAVGTTSLVVTATKEGCEPVSKTITGITVAELPKNVDEITAAAFGITGTSYTEFSNKTLMSGAKYSGKAAKHGTYGVIQLNNAEKGIYSVESLRTLKKVDVTFNSNTVNNRTIEIYAKQGNFAGTQDTDGAVKVATFKKTDSETTFSYSFEDLSNYTNILIRANGAVYLDELKVTWSETKSKAFVFGVSLDQEEATVNMGESLTLNATVDGYGENYDQINWESSDTSKVTVVNGILTPVAITEEPVTITATSVVDSTKLATCAVSIAASRSFTELTTTGGFKTSYKTSATEFVINDLKVFANYSDGSKEEVTDYTITWSEAFNNTAGNHTSIPTIHWDGHDLALSEVSYSVAAPVQSSVTMAMSCANGDGQPSENDGSTAFTSATLLSTTQTISKVSYAWSITNAGDLVTAGATENCYIGKGSTMKVGKSGGDGYFNLIFAEDVKIKSVKITAYGAADTVKLTVDNAGNTQTIGTTSADYTFTFTADTNILKITGGAGKTSSNKVAYISSIVVTYEA